MEQFLATTPHETPTLRTLVPITKTIQVRRTRHAGHCWRSKDELISDVLQWTPTYGRAKAGRPARTYIQQLCEGTGCNSEDLPEAMNDREKWRERVRDIRVGGTTWWWWWWYMCVCVCVCLIYLRVQIYSVKNTCVFIIHLYEADNMICSLNDLNSHSII